jgi:CTP:molybdopterin cytidylyltransferase MocA
LIHVIRTIRKAGVETIIVVLGHAAETVQAQVDLTGCRVVLNPRYETGMAGSLIRGIESISSAADGILIFHADMPSVSEETIRAVIQRAEQGARIAAPSYRTQRGFPVYLHRSCFQELLPTLTGNVGARRYIAQHSEELVLVEVDDRGAIRDIDRPEDLGKKEEAYEPAILEG